MDTIYSNDTRYPGPEIYPAPDSVEGLPTQGDLDAFPRLFTWGELKDVIQKGDLDLLTRNKELQARYETWMARQKLKWGSTEKYLTEVRLPWRSEEPQPANTVPGPVPTYDQRTALSHPEIDLTPSTNPDSKAARKAPEGAGHRRSGSAAVAAHALAVPAATPAQASNLTTAGSSNPGSGASTPSSVAYVSLDAARVRRALKKTQKNESRRRQEVKGDDGNISTSTQGTSENSIDGPEEVGYDTPDVFLRYDPSKGLEKDKFAVLPNDWPYCVPYGVQHYCVWSRIPIAHPVLVDYDREAWEKIENEGLGGFTGIIPVIDESEPPSGTESDVADGAVANGSAAYEPSGRAGPAKAGKYGWYAIDVKYSGPEFRRWAGVEYESKGGHEIGNMVKGLWDERGWECLWFVNPARLQSVPGYAHFHVFVRRKTPSEIDLSEKVCAERETHKVTGSAEVKKGEKGSTEVKTGGVDGNEGAVEHEQENRPRGVEL